MPYGCHNLYQAVCRGLHQLGVADQSHHLLRTRAAYYITQYWGQFAGSVEAAHARISASAAERVCTPGTYTAHMLGGAYASSAELGALSQLLEVACTVVDDAGNQVETHGQHYGQEIVLLRRSATHHDVVVPGSSSWTAVRRNALRAALREVGVPLAQTPEDAAAQYAAERLAMHVSGTAFTAAAVKAEWSAMQQRAPRAHGESLDAHA